MEILSKRNIQTALTNPFIFVILFILIIFALINSFALWCLIAALAGIPISLISLNKISPDFLVKSMCKDTSWKLKSINILSNFLGKHALFIIVLGIICWALLNFTSKGQEIISWFDD